jgi:predicted PurR-regulated permease PerM
VLILFFLGWFGVSALPEIFIRPILMGRRVHIHPVVMFIGFIGGIVTMGLAGFVVGPVALVLLITGYRIYREREKGSELPMAEHPV